MLKWRDRSNPHPPPITSRVLWVKEVPTDAQTMHPHEHPIPKNGAIFCPANRRTTRHCADLHPANSPPFQHKQALFLGLDANVPHIGTIEKSSRTKKTKTPNETILKHH